MSDSIGSPGLPGGVPSLESCWLLPAKPSSSSSPRTPTIGDDNASTSDMKMMPSLLPWVEMMTILLPVEMYYELVNLRRLYDVLRVGQLEDGVQGSLQETVWKGEQTNLSKGGSFPRLVLIIYIV